MKVLSLLLGLLHLSGVACLQNKANRVADAEDKNVRATTRSKSPHSATNGIEFGHPLLPPPMFDLVELYKAPESSKKGNNTHSHSIDFKGPAGEALRLSYNVQFEAGTTVVCLDHLSGIASGSAISHKSAEKESVEVGFHLPKYAEILVDALESGVGEAALSTVYVTGGMHWGSKDHSDGSARPLLLKLGGFDRDGTTLRLWGSPVGYQHIFKNADIHISTNAVSSQSTASFSDESNKRSGESAEAKPLKLVDVSERAAVVHSQLSTSSHGWSWNPFTWSWSFNPFSWKLFATSVAALDQWVQSAYNDCNKIIKDVLNGIGEFVWTTEAIAKALTTGKLIGTNTTCRSWGWNLMASPNGCLGNQAQVKEKSILIQKRAEHYFGAESTITCENCYAKAQLTVTATINIKSWKLQSVYLDATGRLDSEINLKGDFQSDYAYSNLIQVSKSIVGNQQHWFVVGGIPVYVGMRVPLSIGYDAQIDGKVQVDASASMHPMIQAGFTYDGTSVQRHYIQPSDHPQGTYEISGAVKAAATLYIVPVIALNLYKFAEVDIQVRPQLGLTVTVDATSSQSGVSCPTSQSSGHIRATTVFNGELFGTLKGGLNVDWPGVKYTDMTDPMTIFHLQWPILTHCNQYLPTSGSSFISGALESPRQVSNQVSRTRSEPTGLFEGQIFSGFFKRLDECADDFMPKGQLSMLVTSVKYAANASMHSCPKEFDVHISANDNTEPTDPDAHACVSVKKMKVRVTPRKDLNRCDLHFDAQNARHVYKGCTQVKDKESSCNNFPKLAGSADTNFGILRLHDEHLRGGDECIRGVVTRSNIQEAAAQCQDSSNDLNAIASERGITGQYSCNDAKEAGYCGDPDVAQACCNTCIATWLSQA